MAGINTVIGDKKSAFELKAYVDKYISNLNGQKQYVQDCKEIETEVKSKLGLAPAKFKQIVNGIVSGTKLEESIKELNEVSNAVNALDNLN